MTPRHSSPLQSRRRQRIQRLSRGWRRSTRRKGLRPKPSSHIAARSPLTPGICPRVSGLPIRCGRAASWTRREPPTAASLISSRLPCTRTSCASAWIGRRRRKGLQGEAHAARTPTWPIPALRHPDAPVAPRAASASDCVRGFKCRVLGDTPSATATQRTGLLWRLVTAGDLAAAAAWAAAPARWPTRSATD